MEIVLAVYIFCVCVCVCVCVSVNACVYLSVFIINMGRGNTCVRK